MLHPLGHTVSVSLLFSMQIHKHYCQTKEMKGEGKTESLQTARETRNLSLRRLCGYRGFRTVRSCLFFLSCWFRVDEVSTLRVMLSFEWARESVATWNNSRGTTGIYGKQLPIVQCTITPAKHVSASTGLWHLHPCYVYRGSTCFWQIDDIHRHYHCGCGKWRLHAWRWQTRWNSVAPPC